MPRRRKVDKLPTHSYLVHSYLIHSQPTHPDFTRSLAVGTPSNDMTASLEADCKLVSELWICLTSDITCGLTSTLRGLFEHRATHAHEQKHNNKRTRKCAHHCLLLVLARNDLHFTRPPTPATYPVMLVHHPPSQSPSKDGFERSSGWPLLQRLSASPARSHTTSSRNCNRLPPINYSVPLQIVCAHVITSNQRLHPDQVVLMFTDSSNIHI